MNNKTEKKEICPRCLANDRECDEIKKILDNPPPISKNLVEAFKKYGAETTTPKPNGWEEEFDKLTDTSSCPDGGCKEANEWLKNNKTLYSDEVYGEPMFDLDEDKIKAFIRQAVTKAEDNMRKRCVEALPKDTSDYIEELGLTIENPSKKEFLYQATQNINNLDKE